MKVTIVAGPSYPIPAVLGGATAKAWELLSQEFGRHGTEVTIIAPRHGKQPDEERQGSLRFIRVRGFTQSSRIVWDLARDSLFALRLLPRLPQADVLVCNDFWLPVLARARKRAGRIVVCAGRYPKGQYILYGSAWRVVAHSEAIAAAIRRQCPALSDRVVTIPLPLDPLLAPAARRPAGRVLQYVGRVHPEKGVHLLVQAFAELTDAHPGWRLRIVGPSDAGQGGGGAAYLDQLRALAVASPAVEFTGPIFDRALLARAYAEADLLCYPSLAEHGEAFGVVPLEAMAAGVPPVVSRLACFEDFVHDGDNGWAFDHRAADPVRALAGVLDTAMRDDAERARRGARGREQAQRYSVRSVAQRYLEEFALP